MCRRYSVFESQNGRHQDWPDHGLRSLSRSWLSLKDSLSCSRPTQISCWCEVSSKVSTLHFGTKHITIRQLLIYCRACCCAHQLRMMHCCIGPFITMVKVWCLLLPCCHAANNSLSFGTQATAAAAGSIGPLTGPCLSRTEASCQQDWPQQDCRRIAQQESPAAAAQQPQELRDSTILTGHQQQQ
jgi:hypothetical protein